MKRSSISFIFMLLCITTADAQKRYVIVDMEIGVPQRDVRVRWEHQETPYLQEAKEAEESKRDN